MNGTPLEILTSLTAFARSSGTPSRPWLRTLGPGLGMDAVPDGTSFRDSPSASCTSSGATKSRSLAWLTRRGGPAIGARDYDGPSNIRIRRSALRAAADPAPYPAERTVRRQSWVDLE